MYVIVAYDVGIERVNKLKGYLRTQLTWIQNSLFEGELTESRHMEIKDKISELIDPEHDSVVIYKFPNNNVITREEIGIRKGSPDEVVI